MWSDTDVCSPVAINVVIFALNPVAKGRIVASNVVRNLPMFAVQSADVCSPLHLSALSIKNVEPAFNCFRSTNSINYR